MSLSPLVPNKCQSVPASEMFARIFCKIERIGHSEKSHDDIYLRECGRLNRGE